jgi:hypothetical protein
MASKTLASDFSLCNPFFVYSRNSPHGKVLSMKKILIAHTLKQFVPGENTVLAREDLRTFTAATTDDIISIYPQD